MDIRNGCNVNEFILMHPFFINIFKCGYYELFNIIGMWEKM